MVFSVDIEIVNMDYGDFDEKEYEIFGLMTKAQNWVSSNINALITQAESEDLMQMVDEQEEYSVSL